MTDKEYQHALELIERGTRADERKKCGEELLKAINEKPYGTEKTNWWLISQINHICFGIPRICDEKEWLKEQKND